MDQNRLISRLLRCFALLGLFAAPAQAQQGFESLDKLDQLVAITVGSNIGEPNGPVAPIDRRLRLKPCPTTPKVEGPVFNAAIVSCAETGWRIRVPLNIVAPTADRRPLFAAAPGRLQAAPASQASSEVVIKKGDPVELIAGSDVFSVSRLMIADEDGAVGQMIRVREDPKSAPVSARVERAGRVRAPTI
ncbi:MAG: flagella basal body P-ring formation protein FlgA [Sphingobium sp.]|nr:flagella basal body P-ring formation protein FlgA [Sphingobium sp.]